MDATSELAAAGQRQARLASEIQRVQAELARRKEARKKTTGGGGSGRLSKKEQRTENKLNAELKLLKDGVFPGESVPVQRQSAESLVSSAREHAAHHADPQLVPSGRTASVAAGSCSSALSGGLAV